MSNETKLPNPDAAVLKASALLLRHIPASELKKDLDSLFQSFLKSEWSDDQDHRSKIAETYENLNDFLRTLRKVEKDNREALLSNLKNPVQC